MSEKPTKGQKSRIIRDEARYNKEIEEFYKGITQMRQEEAAAIYDSELWKNWKIKVWG